MAQLYGDEYDYAAADDGRLIPGRARRLAGAVVFLALIGSMGLWAYRLGTRDAAEVPIIRAMEGPSRVQPADPGGLRAAHQGLEVNTVLAGKPAADSASGAAAAPAPSALAEEDGPQGELVIAAPTVLAAEALAAGEDLPLPPSDDAGGGAVALIEAPTAIEAVDPANSSALVAEALGETPPADAAALAEAALDPAEAGPGPMRRPSNLVLARAAGPAADATPAAAKPAPKPAEAEAAQSRTRETASTRAGSRMVQLGAFDSEALARQAWNILASANRDLLASKSLHVERTTANARVFYRLRVAGFENQSQTRTMCEALRARNVDCIPVTLQ